MVINIYPIMKIASINTNMKIHDWIYALLNWKLLFCKTFVFFQLAKIILVIWYYFLCAMLNDFKWNIVKSSTRFKLRIKKNLQAGNKCIYNDLIDKRVWANCDPKVRINIMNNNFMQKSLKWKLLPKRYISWQFFSRIELFNIFSINF